MSAKLALSVPFACCWLSCHVFMQLFFYEQINDDDDDDDFVPTLNAVLCDRNMVAQAHRVRHRKQRRQKTLLLLAHL